MNDLENQNARFMVKAGVAILAITALIVAYFFLVYRPNVEEAIPDDVSSASVGTMYRNNQTHALRYDGTAQMGLTVDDLLLNAREAAGDAGVDTSTTNVQAMASWLTKQGCDDVQLGKTSVHGNYVDAEAQMAYGINIDKAMDGANPFVVTVTSYGMAGGEALSFSSQYSYRANVVPDVQIMQHFQKLLSGYGY